MSSIYSIGQMNQLADKLEMKGFTAEDITKLGQYDCNGFRGVLNGTHKVVPIEKELKPERIRVINETTIMVNLDAPPRLPFNGSQIESQVGSGWVKVEKRDDVLYVDGHKIILYLSRKQKREEVIKGHALREALAKKFVLHPNIMDALIDHPHLIPEDWKKDEKGNTRHIFFWAVIFSDGRDHFYVRQLYFLWDQWNLEYNYLGNDWRADAPAALAYKRIF